MLLHINYVFFKSLLTCSQVELLVGLASKLYQKLHSSVFFYDLLFATSLNNLFLVGLCDTEIAAVSVCLEYGSIF